MNARFVRVSELTANDALMIYRRMGPDLRLLIHGPLDPMPVGWAFMPENSGVLKHSVIHFLQRNDVTVVKIFNNDFDFVDPSYGLAIWESQKCNPCIDDTYADIM
jgi:hypothetical protein